MISCPISDVSPFMQIYMISGIAHRNITAYQKRVSFFMLFDFKVIEQPLYPWTHPLVLPGNDLVYRVP